MSITMDAPPESTYEETRRHQQAHFFQQLGPHIDRLGWTAEQLQAERERRLRALLRVAHQRSAWHRNRLPYSYSYLDSLTETDLARVPPMTKADLMSNFDSIVTDSRVTLELADRHVAGLTRDAYLLGTHHAIASGGSSGKRGVYVYDWDGWTDWTLLCLRYLLRLRQRAGAGPGESVTAVVMAEVASHGSSASPQCFRDAFAGSRLLRFASSLPMDEIVRGLDECRPDVLMSYPSILMQLAARAREGELRIAPKLICTTAEPLLQEIRAAAHAVWGVPIVNMWGTSEGGAIACGCGAGSGMHLSDDLLIVEPVDADGNPVPPDTRSAKIYLTNLFNHLMPLIRYELTDEVTLATRACPCGSAHRLVEDVQGRLEDRFVYEAVAPVHSLLFHTVLDPVPAIVEYQVRQTGRGADVLVVQRGQADLDRLARAIEAALSRVGVASPAVTIRPVERIERPVSGKLKRFVPLA